MASPASKRLAEKTTVNAAFWGKWGAYSPKTAEHYFRQAWNRGYGQPLITGRYAAYEEKGSTLAFFARRWKYDWLKHVAMRVDAERVPLIVLRRQIMMAMLEYTFRRVRSRKSLIHAAKVEWAYIKERLKQPFTWTGHDAGHAFFWTLNVVGFFCIGEAYSRGNIYGYGHTTNEWTPARPRFTPGFYHVYDPFENYPFENQPSYIAKQFQRSSWWPNSYESYWSPHRITLGYPY